MASTIPEPSDRPGRRRSPSARAHDADTRGESMTPDAPDHDADATVGPATAASEVPSSADAEAVERSVLEELTEVLDAWKTELEREDWAGLVERIGLPAWFVEGHPENARELVRRLDELTEDRCDFEAVLSTMDRTDVTKDRVRLSFRLRVLWSSMEDWEDHDLLIEVHTGFERRDDEWVATHLLLNRADEEAQPNGAHEPRSTTAPPGGGADDGEDTPAVDPRQTGDNGRARRSRAEDTFAEAAARYFAGSADDEDEEDEGARPAGNRKQLMYLPVFVDADLLRELLG